MKGPKIDANSNVEIWSLKDGQRLHSITNISEGEFRAAFSPDSTTLAILDIPKSQLSLWDTRSGTLKKSLPYGGPSQSSTSLFGPFIFGPDGQSLVLQSVFEDTTHLWSLGDDSYVSFASAWYSLTPFSPDGNKFAFADPKQLDKSLTVMDVASRQVKSFGSGSPSDSTYAVFAGSHVVVAKWFDRVIAWDVESNQELWNRECESPGRWNDSSLSQDQRKLAVVSDDFPNFVEVWDVQDGRKVLTISHRLS